MDNINIYNNENIESENKNNSIIINFHNNYIKAINDIKNILYEYYKSEIKLNDKSSQNKISLYFNQISSIIKLLSERIDSFFVQYESNLRQDEQKLRALYSEIFNMKIKNAFLENNIEALLKKEKEYRLVKEKTGVIVENGNIFYNNRKDNEIFILRQENSNLKNVVFDNENKLKDFQKRYENDKNNFEKKISELNRKISILKIKLCQKGIRTKIKSELNMSKTSNDLNKFHSKNNSMKKNSSSFYKLEYNSVIKDINNDINKKDLKNRRNVNEKQNLTHCQSTDHAVLKNKMKSKLNSLKQNGVSKKSYFLNITKINKNDINHQKTLYYTSKNYLDNINRLNYNSLKQINKIRNRSRIDNNKTLINSINKINDITHLNINDIKKRKIMNKTPKNNNIKNKIYQYGNRKIKNEITLTSYLDNPILTTSPVKINKIYVINHNIKKIEKDLNI